MPPRALQPDLPVKPAALAREARLQPLASGGGAAGAPRVAIAAAAWAADLRATETKTAGRQSLDLQFEQEEETEAKEAKVAGVRRGPAGLHPAPALPGYHPTDLHSRDRPGPSAALRLFRRELPSSTSVAVFPTATCPAAAAAASNAAVAAVTASGAAPADDASRASNTSSPSSAAAAARQPSTIASATALGVEGAADAGGADGAKDTGGAESGADAATARHAWLQGVRVVDMRSCYGYAYYGYAYYGYAYYGYAHHGCTDYGYAHHGYTGYGYTCKVCAWWT